MEVAIFGAGIAGLMTAITLGDEGRRCRIYERLSPGTDSGMGFILMPAGVHCLQRFGIDFTGTLQGVPLDRYYGRSAAGEILHEQAMPVGARSMRRRALVEALEKILKGAGNLTFDAELRELEFDQGGRVAAARLNSGARVQADLYVAADGARSRARQALFPDWPAPQAQVLEIVGLARCKSAVRWAGNHFNKFHALLGGAALGVLPVDSEHVVWYVQFDARRFPPPRENGSASPEVRQTFVEGLVGDWADPVGDLLDATDFSKVHLWRPVDSDLIPRFHRGNLVLVGDAAHPLLPFTSQGVSSAIADAVALAHALNAGIGADVGEALALYSAERREQCAPFVDKGRDLTRRFLAPQAVSGALLPVA
jgi:2-polyprenyl-6-methoxyphenol hydroxylase-like FAD-dependent oxidoreductase